MSTTSHDNQPRLFDLVQRTAFDSDDAVRLMEHLRKVDTETIVDSVTSVDDLTLSSSGELAGGYRFSDTAFTDVCRLLCRGLRGLVLDVSGMHKSIDDSTDNFSMPEAVKIYNMVLNRRFDSVIAGKLKLIKDTQTKIIDGILGPTSIYLENAQFFELVQDCISQSQFAVDFNSAVINGRRLTLKFVTNSPIVSWESSAEGNEPETFSGGYCFINSGISHECSVRASLLVQRDWNESHATSYPIKLRHSGKNFKANLNKMFKRILEKSNDFHKVAKWIDDLVGKNIGLGKTQKSREERTSQLVRALFRRIGSVTISNKIVSQLVYFGRYCDEDSPMEFVGISDQDSRTVMDICCATMHEAALQPDDVREVLEYTAYCILDGRFKF